MAGVGLVVSGVETSEFLDFAEIVCNEVAPSIDVPIMRDGAGPTPVCGDDGLSTAHFEPVAQMISIISLVTQKSAKAQPVDQVCHGGHFAALAGQETEPDEISERIRQGDDLRGQSAP